MTLNPASMKYLQPQPVWPDIPMVGAPDSPTIPYPEIKSAGLEFGYFYQKPDGRWVFESQYFE